MATLTTPLFLKINHSNVLKHLSYFFRVNPRGESEIKRYCDMFPYKLEKKFYCSFCLETYTRAHAQTNQRWYSSVERVLRFTVGNFQVHYHPFLASCTLYNNLFWQRTFSQGFLSLPSSCSFFYLKQNQHFNQRNEHTRTLQFSLLSNLMKLILYGRDINKLCYGCVCHLKPIQINIHTVLSNGKTCKKVNMSQNDSCHYTL